MSNLSSLQQLNCYGNALTSLNLSGATALSTLDCSGNQLYNIDLSTNTSLSTFFCSNNLIIESQNLALSSAVSSINEAGGTAFIGAQQYMEGYDFNAEEVQNLTEFANSALNLEKLGWDLSDPWSWAGIQWKIYGDEYHIAAVNLDNLDLEGDLNLPDAAYLESLSCANSALSTLNLSGCTTVSAVDCYNSGISTLELNGCTSLSAINCNENYLEIEDVESSFSQIGLQTGLATYENQNIGADEESFDAHEREELIALLSTGDNAEILGWDWNWPGTWDGIVWTRDEEGTYRVNKINFAQLDVVGTLDLTGFDYLEDFNFSGTALEAVTLPDCITGIPAYAFYKSAVETVYLSDGITAVKEQAFAYCSSLKTVTLPASVTKIEDAAFFGCTKLANLVFAGDAPLSVGSQVFSNTAPTFRITIFEDTDWSGGTGLLDSYQYQVSSTPYTLLMDNDLALITDDSYGPTNIYPGDDIRVTIATPTPDEDVVCLLVVYNENGALDNVSVEKVSLEQYQTDLFFQDVNIQYVGEEFCQIKVFLCAADGSLVPLAQCTNTLLFKPLES